MRRLVLVLALTAVLAACNVPGSNPAYPVELPSIGDAAYPGPVQLSSFDDPAYPGPAVRQKTPLPTVTRAIATAEPTPTATPVTPVPTWTLPPYPVTPLPTDPSFVTATPAYPAP